MSLDQTHLRTIVPDELQLRPQWVLWKYVDRDGKTTKMPIDPRTGGHASSTDNSTWTSFDDALTATRNFASIAGIGFVFTQDDPFVGVDLDECIVDGQVASEAQDIIDSLNTYTEISPSGNGVKLIGQATKPDGVGCRSKAIDGYKEIEIYDAGRFFTITGRHLLDTPTTVGKCQEAIGELCHRLWPKKQTESPHHPAGGFDGHDDELIKIGIASKHGDRFERLLNGDTSDYEHDHSRADLALCNMLAFWTGRDPDRMDRLFRASGLYRDKWERPDYRNWTINKAVENGSEVFTPTVQAADVDISGIVPNAPPGAVSDGVVPHTCVGQLLADHPHLRPPVIEGLLRQGETMNVIAPAKAGKSWLVNDLAIAVATGTPWLGRYETHRGDVLLIDNELHPETTANRIPKVAAARHIPLSKIADSLFVANLRGGLLDIVSLGPYFQSLKPGRFRVIVLDAWYRYMPAGTDENDNGTMASLYNQLDHHAARLECCFILIHHSSKGGQASKAVTDVGAGAGAQSRAADAHLVLRAHEEKDVIVLDAAVRSWPPIEPVCLRRNFPVWDPDDTLDPASLAGPRSRRSKSTTPSKPKPEPWTPERFVEAFITEAPQRRDKIFLSAANELPKTQAKQLLSVAEADGLIHRWQDGYSDPVRFSTKPQPAFKETS